MSFKTLMIIFSLTAFLPLFGKIDPLIKHVKIENLIENYTHEEIKKIMIAKAIKEIEHKLNLREVKLNTLKSGFVVLKDKEMLMRIARILQYKNEKNEFYTALIFKAPYDLDSRIRKNDFVFSELSQTTLESLETRIAELSKFAYINENVKKKCNFGTELISVFDHSQTLVCQLERDARSAKINSNPLVSIVNRQIVFGDYFENLSCNRVTNVLRTKNFIGSLYYVAFTNIKAEEKFPNACLIEEKMFSDEILFKFPVLQFE